MKKLLLIALFACAFFGNAQSQVIFYEDFDGITGPTAGGAGTYVFPPGWLLRNVDNGTPDAQVSYVNEAWERREDFSFNVGDSAAFSTSYYAPAGTANDWMWTPQIGPLPANCVLSWNAVTYDAAYPDGYEVRIITAPTVPTGGTGVIGNQITSSTVLFSTAAENTSWTSRSVNLNAYAGQSVYIGFRNNSVDKFLLLIDDIKVEVILNYDAQLLSTDTITEYTMTPLPQAAPMNFSGSIRNNGLNALTNVMLNVNVFNSANVNVYSASSPGAGLAPGATSTFTVAPYTPVAADNYTVRYHVSATETDQMNSNDTLYDTFMVTDTIYARDNGIVTGSLGIGAGNGGYLGQDFEILNTDDLTSVSMYFTRGYTGKKLAAAIWNMSAGVPSTILASTDTILYPDDSARVYTLAIHGGPVNLAPGRYAITAIEFDSTLALGQTSELFTTGRTWVNWPTNPFGGWANNEDFGASFAKSYLLRANFGVICSIVSTIGSSTNPTCNGSNDGSITVSSTGGTGTLTYTWSPNVSTTATASNLPGGTYSVTVTDANGCPSSASVTLTEPAAIDITTTVNGDTITANAAPATYQWLDCNNGNAPINGATSQSYAPSTSGDYAVVITQNSCSDTSACVNMVTVGINQQTGLTGGLDIYPNPTSGMFIIRSNTEGSYAIYNDLGQVVKTIELSARNNYSIAIDDLDSGIYMISGVTNNKVVKQKIVINK